MIEILVSAAEAKLLRKELLTAGRTGLVCRFRFGQEWEELQKIVVFRGAADYDCLLDGDSLTVPARCLTESGKALNIGVYGTNENGTVVIPTLWVNCGMIQPGTQLVGMEAEEPSPNLVAQIYAAATDARGIAQQLREAAEKGEFKGEKGDPGEKGDKGDIGPAYELTAEDKTAISNEVKSGLILPARQVQAAGRGLDELLPGKFGETDAYVPVTVIAQADYEELENTDAVEADRLYLISDGEPPRDGASAYELAVKNGYSGSEREWLASLKGEQGDKGETGAQGPKGDKGDTGPQGPAGANADPVILYDTTGDNTDGTMTQKAVTEALAGLDSGLPEVTAADNGKVLLVVDGAWAASSLPSASGVSF